MKTLGKIIGILTLAVVTIMAAGCGSSKAGKKTTVVPGSGADTIAKTDLGTAGFAALPLDPLSEEWMRQANWTQLPKVYFDFDRAVIRPSEQGKMQQIADYLRTNPQMVMVIAGHCDERGTSEYNRALGERRALAARDYLLRLGISGDRLYTISYGEERPAVEGSNEAAWAQNRRAEFGVGARR